MTPLDLTTVTNYSAAAVRSAVGGSITAGGAAIQSPSAAALHNQLAAWTTAAVSAIQQNQPSKSGADIAGYRPLVFQYLASLPTALPGGQIAQGGGSSWTTWSGAPYTAAQIAFRSRSRSTRKR